VRRQGKPVGRLYQGADGRWRTREEIMRKVAEARAEAREEWARTHPVEALELAMMDMLRLAVRLGAR
jgi:hypothetical protein